MTSQPAIAASYIARSYTNAGIDAAAWHPSAGFRANRLILERLYYYYQELYFKNPSAFLWAGLARLTGGQVLYGMQNLTRIAKDPCVLTQEIMAVAKDIFESLAWQHELYLDDRQTLYAICAQTDAATPQPHPYTACWQTIDACNISGGNKMLLHNEQFNTIQPHYNLIKKDAYSARYFWFTRFVMRQIHPHHRRFIFSVPLGDVTVFKDRWQWIEGASGMWHTWAALPQAERDRLVGLSNEAVVGHHW